MKYFNKILCFFAVSILSAVSFSCSSDDEPAEDPVQVGDTIPRFSVTLTDGTTVSSESLRGSQSMIVFFYTNCPDCQAELPEIQKVYQAVGCQPGTHTADKTQVLCISREENQESVVDYWKRNSFTMPASAQETRDVFELFANSTVPRIYIVNSDLKVTNIYIEEKVEASTLLSALGY